MENFSWYIFGLHIVGSLKGFTLNLVLINTESTLSICRLKYWKFFYNNIIIFDKILESTWKMWIPHQKNSDSRFSAKMFSFTFSLLPAYICHCCKTVSILREMLACQRSNKTGSLNDGHYLFKTERSNSPIFSFIFSQFNWLICYHPSSLDK